MHHQTVFPKKFVVVVVVVVVVVGVSKNSSKQNP